MRKSTLRKTPESLEEPVVLHTARNAAEATTLLATLDDAGLEVWSEDAPFVLYGAHPTGARLWVRRADLERASDVLRRFLERPS